MSLLIGLLNYMLLQARTALVYVHILSVVQVPLGIVKAKYFTMMTSCILYSYLLAVVSWVLGHWAPRSSLNPKGNTGNPLVDLFNGRQMNPTYLGMDWKLQTLRYRLPDSVISQ